METPNQERKPLTLQEAEEKLRRTRALLEEVKEVDRTGMYNGVDAPDSKQVFGKDVVDIEHDIQQLEDYIVELKGDSNPSETER